LLYGRWDGRDSRSGLGVADLLRDEPAVELLPVRLLDHAKKARPETYYVINVLALDALDLERCYPGWSHIIPTRASDLGAYVVDRDKLGKASIFRPARVSGPPVIVTRELADKLRPLAGVRITYAKR
jgi:hypothetical protein